MIETAFNIFLECFNSPKVKGFILFILLILLISQYVDIRINSIEYLKENGNYYQFYNDDVSWDDAKIKCEKIGGHLASINDEKENKIVESIMGYSQIWLGGFKFKDNWLWVSEEDFNYENWSEDEPNNHAGRENVIVMLLNGDWNDETKMIYYTDGSIEGLSYVCEWENKVNITINIFDSYWSFGIF